MQADLSPTAKFFVYGCHDSDVKMVDLWGCEGMYGVDK
jgi:hypothetical protein